MKKYIATLTKEERKLLTEIASKGTQISKSIKRVDSIGI
jgi:hypothetical protein